jgi:lysozyme
MAMYDEAALKRELIRDEGQRMKPYRDSLGNWTVGVGHLLVGNELQRFVDAATGKPRRTLTEAECGDMLIGDIVDAEHGLNRILPGWRDLDDVRQRALLNLSFNLGPRLGKFVGFLRCVEDRPVGRRRRAPEKLAVVGAGEIARAAHRPHDRHRHGVGGGMSWGSWLKPRDAKGRESRTLAFVGMSWLRGR